MPTLYEIIGVLPTATAAEIKAAYRQKVVKVHPDAGGDLQEMAELNSAYQVLRDPEKRRHYDETGLIEDKSLFVDHTNMVNFLVKCFDDAVGMVGGNMQLTNTFVVERMKDSIAKHIATTEEIQAGLLLNIKTLEDIMSQVAVPANDKSNIFFQIIRTKIEKMREAHTGNTAVLRIQKMAAEEMEPYSTLAEYMNGINTITNPSWGSTFSTHFTTSSSTTW